MSCFNMGNERLFPNRFSAIDLVVSQKHLSYLQSISMDLVNSSYLCLHTIFYDIYILQEFRRPEEEKTTTNKATLHTFLISAPHSLFPSVTLEFFVVLICSIS